MLLILGGLVTVPFGVPLLPVDTFLRFSQALPFASVKTERDATVPLPQLYADMFGWENMAATVAGVYHDLPQADQPDCAILAGNYGEAGAIDYYGPKLGLPKAISGHNSYFDWGPRNYSGECVIIFGEAPANSRSSSVTFSRLRRSRTATRCRASKMCLCTLPETSGASRRTVAAIQNDYLAGNRDPAAITVGAGGLERARRVRVSRCRYQSPAICD